MIRTLVLCVVLGGGLGWAQDSRPTSKPTQAQDPSKALKEQLKRPITLQIPEGTVEDGVAFVVDVTGLNLVLGPLKQRSAELSLKLDQVPLSKALDGIAGAADLKWSIVAGEAVVLHPAGSPAPTLPAVDKAWLQAHGEKKLDVNFDPDVPLKDALEFVGMLSGVKTKFDPALAEAPVQLRLKQTRVSTLLTLFAAQTNSTWTVKDGTVSFAPKPEQK